MNCASCGHENPDRAKFCLECGGAFSLRCSACGTELPVEAKFCLECGTPAASAGSNAPLERSPADYTPKHLADKILQNRSALEGERKHVTILFADVKGSMELAGQVDPEAWHGILDGFFQILTEGVHRFEGTVNQYTGDGIMALFGAPISHEDHAQRACYTALHLIEEMRTHALDVRRRHGLDFALRMGLNSGDVVVGKIGDDLRMDYTAAGQSVGLAQRMESLAEAGSCYLTDATASLASGYFELEDLGEFQVKGVGDGVRVHKLLGMGAARTRFDVSRSRGLTRFVGRGDDMRTLEAALDRARQGQGSALGIFAEAGTGKSRICFEFLEACRAQGLRVVEGRAVAHGKNIPLIPVLEILRSYFAVSERDDPREAREKIAGRLLLLDERFRDVLPLLFDFLGVGDPTQPAPRMESEARQRRLFGVTRGLLGLTTAERPGIILIEDLHWLDGASEAWVREWLDAVAGTHNLLLLNSRPEYHADWMQRSHYQQLALAPLGPDAIRDLLEELLGADDSTVGLADAIHQRTRGNPFFAEEVVRSLIESGHLVGTPGAFVLASPVEDLRVPDSVQSLLASRIDRLEDSQKHLLQSAAVIGKQFREPLLERVCELSNRELGETLSSLRDAEFIYPESLYPVAEYAFKHPLTQEVALGSQLQDTRRRSHAAVARAIEELDAARLDEQAATLAHHWEQAEERTQSTIWHARAARRAMSTDTEEALRHWDRVRVFASEQPDEGSSDLRPLLGDAYVQLINLGWRQGLPPSQAREYFDAGKQLLDDLGDRRGRVLLTSNFTLVGGIDAAERVECYKEAVTLARELGDVPLEIAVGSAIFPALYRGLLELANEGARRTVELIEKHGWAGDSPLYFDPHRWIYSARAFTRMLQCDVAGAVEDSDRGLELGRDGDDFDRWISHNLRAWVDLWRGEFVTSLVHARRSLEMAEAVGGFNNQNMSLAVLGWALGASGQWQEALPLLERGHAVTQEMQPYNRSRGLPSALLHCGQPQQALELARDNVDQSHRLGIAFSELEMQIELATVATACERLDEARSALAHARRLVATTGFTLFTREILEASAALAAKQGNEDESSAQLAEAQRLNLEMGAIGHVERLARAIAS